MTVGPIDPLFPDRPDHPDFWRLSEAVIHFDGEADGDRDIEDIVGEFIDLPSLLYMADQRILRTGLHSQHPDIRARLLALYVDAFSLGYRIAQPAEPVDPVPRTTEEKIEFRKDWDRRYEEGKKKQ